MSCIARASRPLLLALVAGLLVFIAGSGALHAEPKTWRPRDVARQLGFRTAAVDANADSAAGANTARQAPDATLNVAWDGALWRTTPSFTWAACDVGANVRKAIDIAVGQWRFAAENQGLPISLHEVPCIDGDTDAQIAIFPTTTAEAEIPPDHGVLAGTVVVDEQGEPCPLDVSTPCVAQSAFIGLFTDSWNSLGLSFEEAAKTVAHEIGHAVGLGHAHVCNFDAVMAQNCEPILKGLGTDDVQSLNALVDYTRVYFGQSALHARAIEPAPVGGATVIYHAGWNLLAGPHGTVFAPASGPLYTLVSGDAGYRAIPAQQGASSGFGYWAYFPTDVTVRLNGPGGSFYSVLTEPGQWFMLGNDSGTTPMAVHGADALMVYDTQSGQYRRASVLQPGQAGWVHADSTGEIDVYLTSLTQRQLNCYFDLGNPASCQGISSG